MVPINPKDEPVLPVRRVFGDVRSTILKNELPTNISLLKIIECQIQYARKYEHSLILKLFKANNLETYFYFDHKNSHKIFWADFIKKSSLNYPKRKFNMLSFTKENPKKLLTKGVLAKMTKLWWKAKDKKLFVCQEIKRIITTIIVENWFHSYFAFLTGF